jgi:hypothetical protein
MLRADADFRHHTTVLFGAGLLMFVLFAAVGLTAVFDGYWDDLLAVSVRRAVRWQPAAVGFFLGAEGTPSFSQFALHNRLFYHAARVFPGSPELFWRLVRFSVALLLAVVLMAFVLAVCREFGVIAAWVTYAQIITSYSLMVFASSYSWFGFLQFLPFVMTFMWYGRTRTPGARWFFHAVLALAVFVKALCGYAFLSSIVLSCALAIAYHELKRDSPWRTVLWRMTQGAAAGVAGFVAAFALTAWQASVLLQSGSRAWHAVMAPATVRTFGYDPNSTLMGDLRTYIAYFTKNGQLWIFADVLIGLMFLHFVLARPEAGSVLSRTTRLWLALIVGALAASLSWNTLAWGHMRYHLHVDHISFFIPFNLVVFLFNGYLISTAAERIGPPPKDLGSPLAAGR